MSKATIERRATAILFDFQKSRKIWGDLVSDGLTQANALVNIQLQQGYVDNPGYWPPALGQFLDLKDRFESKLQKRAEAIAVDLQTTFSKMSAQYSKMKLQTSQFEYLMEEATESFGEAFTYRDPVGTTCTLEQIWIQLENAFSLYTSQVIMNREIMDKLIARNEHHEPQFLSSVSVSNHPDVPQQTTPGSTETSETEQRVNVGGNSNAISSSSLDGLVPTQRRDKDQGMILLSAWLNQPHLKTDVLATFDEFCQVELFGSD
ncbi:hypothetical protein EDD11_003339 [Mortierella claussenii]|nr:hypothetical protein EDD11_003339 [Mortierella claussenii]